MAFQSPHDILEIWSQERTRLFASFKFGEIAGSTYCSVANLSDSMLRLSWDSLGNSQGELAVPLADTALDFDHLRKSEIPSGLPHLTEGETCLRLSRNSDEWCILLTIRSMESEYPRLG